MKAFLFKFAEGSELVYELEPKYNVDLPQSYHKATVVINGDIYKELCDAKIKIEKTLSL